MQVGGCIETADVECSTAVECVRNQNTFKATDIAVKGISGSNTVTSKCGQRGIGDGEGISAITSSDSVARCEVAGKNDGVVSCTTINGVVTRVGGDGVVTGTTIKGVIAGTTSNAVVTTTTTDCGGCVTNKSVSAFGTDDRSYTDSSG